MRTRIKWRVRDVPRENVGEKSLLHEFASHSFKNPHVIFLWIGLLLFASVLFVEMCKDDIIIEPFMVSKDLSENGITGELAARLILHEINRIQGIGMNSLDKFSSGSQKSLTPGSNAYTLPIKNEFELAGSKYSISQIADALSPGKNMRTRITGEITKDGEDYLLTVRVSGNSIVSRTVSQKDIFSLAAEGIIAETNLYMLARYYYNSDKDKLGKLISERPDAIEKAKDKKLYVLIGYYILVKKKYMDAITMYKRAINLDRNFAPAYNGLGILYARVGDDVKAMENYDKAISISHSYATPYGNKGSLYLRQKKLEDALNMQNKAIAVDPVYGTAYYNRGQVYQAMNEVDLAHADYCKAIELDYNHAHAYIRLGVSYYNQQKFDKAIEYYNKAIKADPENADAYIMIGVLYYNQQKFDKAIEYYNKALKADPENANAYFKLGVSYHNQQKFDKALEYYNKAIKADPENADAYIMIGVLYYNQQKFDKAIEYYNKAIKADPDKVLAYEKKGKAHKELGDLNKADAAIKKAKELKDKPHRYRIPC